MLRFNTQTAELAADPELCQKVYQGFILGQSLRHIANKYQISQYAARKLVAYCQQKENGAEKGAVK